jgi:3-oxoacyl-[acyl-carrier-protein] synthase-3
MNQYARISGWGSYVPSKILTNTELEALVQTNDEWIRSRTGIVERRIAECDETTSSMAVAASLVALEEAGVSAADLDLVICATTTPDFQVPATASLIQRTLGASKAGAFDLNSACTGFLTGLIVGTQFIQAGTYKKILVIGTETLSRFVDWSDRNTCILFGDGASAVVLEASAERSGVTACSMGSQGDTEGLLTIPAGGSAIPASEDTIEEKMHFIRMSGNELFKIAVRRMQQATEECLAKANLSVSDVSMVIPHQANIRIIDSLQAALGVPREKVFMNIASFGNTGAASVPLALDEYIRQGTVRAGDKLLFVSFGGGISWAAAIVEWG